MAAKSRHYGAILIWLNKVIDSCNTIEHINVATQLVENFDKSRRIETPLHRDFHRMMYIHLMGRLNDKRFTLETH